MKAITHVTFKNTYTVTDPNSLVKQNEFLNITDDLYIIRSTYKRKIYVGRSEEHPNGYDYEYEPAFKLMSKKYSENLAEQGEYDRCLVVWNDEQIWNFRYTEVDIYCKDLLTRRHSDSRAMFDALYYTLNPLQMRYNDGRLKSGFKNHLKRRLNGFAQGSKITNVMLKELQNEMQQSIIQDDMFTPSLLDSMRMFLDNDVNLEQCPFTKEINIRSNMVRFRLSGVQTYCQGTMSSDDILAFGYEYDANNHTFLKENEIMIDGSCYDSREVKVVRCQDCNVKCVDTETVDGICVDCCGRDYRVHNYTHRVEETLGFDRQKLKSEPYLGIEMEFQVDKRKAGRLYVGNTMFGHALMKDDGSITNGFELVSRPAGYTTHLARYDSFLTDLPEYIHPHKSCGMHVHISRKAFTYLGAGKLVEFMNREDNKDFVKLIAGRGTTNYQNRDNNYDKYTPYQQAVKDRYVGRYNFVNLNNKKTIELRIFATPANKLEFNIRMQFVKAMIEYCKPAIHSVSLEQQTYFKSFVTWLDNTKKDFKELHNYIKESTICA
jgi:hypothetical protein